VKNVDFKVPDGKMLKIKLEVDNERIISIRILGDFFLHPETTIEEIEAALIGMMIDVQMMTEKIHNVIQASHSTLIGAKPSDIAKAIEKAYLQ